MSYLQNLQKIQYKDYKIYNEYNFLLLNSLKEIHELSIKNNLNFIVTGSFALLFHTNKIYRTIGDVDIIVHINELSKWLQLLKNYYDFLFIGEVKEFFQYCLKNKMLLPFKNKQNNIKLEISTFYPTKNIYDIQIDNLNFKYFLPLKLKKEKDFFYDRERDRDDIDFYSKLILNSDID